MARAQYETESQLSVYKLGGAPRKLDLNGMAEPCLTARPQHSPGQDGAGSLRSKSLVRDRAQLVIADHDFGLVS